MFTIIFLDRHTSKVFSRYRYLFRPFELIGDVTFCDWDERETSANTAVAPLRNLVHGKREWRAVILNTDVVPVPNDPDFRRSFVPDSANPFDYSEVDRDRGPHESPIPIIRLSHILGGYASEPKLEFVEATHADEEPRSATVREHDTTGQTTRARAENTVYVPRERSDSEIKMHEALSRKYQLDYARPAEICLIALRSTNLSDERRKLRDAWRAPLEMASSTFWETNRYPGSCRFLCADIRLNDTAVKDRDLTRFWYAVLTLSISRIPSPSLQPYKLYTLGISLSREHLQAILNEHIDLLMQANDYVWTELNKAPESTNKTFGDPMEHIREHIEIEVSPEDDINYFESLMREQKDGGSTKDVINSEKTVQDGAAEVIGTLAETIKDPRRGIERAAMLLRKKVDYYSRQDRACDLVCDQIQLENLRQAMTDLEKSVLTARPSNLFDREKARAAARMTGEQAERQHDSVSPLWAFGCCAAMILTGFVSYLWDAAHIDLKTFLLSLLTVIAVEFIVYHVGKLSYRMQTIKAREANNLAFKKLNSPIERDIRNTKDRFGQYFSNVCSLMKYYSIADKLNKYEDETCRRYSMLEIHRTAIQNAIEDDSAWLCDFEMERTESAGREPREFSDLAETAPENHALYSWTISDKSLEIPLNNTGDRVRQPYAFVEKLLIEREELFDRPASRSEA